MSAARMGDARRFIQIGTAHPKTTCAPALRGHSTEKSTGMPRQPVQSTIGTYQETVDTLFGDAPLVLQIRRRDRKSQYRSRIDFKPASWMFSHNKTPLLGVESCLRKPYPCSVRLRRWFQSCIINGKANCPRPSRLCRA